MKRVLSLVLAMLMLMLMLILMVFTSCAPVVVTPGIWEVEAAYQKAMEAYFWFYVTTISTEDFDSSDSSTYMDADGMIYSKVKHDTIKTYADLENYLHMLFADDIVAELLDDEGDFQRYRDFNDALYAVLADRGTDISKGEETLEVNQESSLKFICTVHVELLDEKDYVMVTGYETHEYAYELIDGRWVFTNFYLFR